MRERTRLLLALLCGVLVLALVLPYTPWQGVLVLALVLPYTPWQDLVVRLGLWCRVVAMVLLALCAWCIPRRPFPSDRAKPDATLLGMGLLLLLEPFLHMALLAWATRAADPSLLGLILPPPSASVWAVLSALPLTVILPPLIEEWVFRGRLFDLVRHRLGPFNAVTITALAFAVAHGSVVAALVALPTGLLLGFIRLAGRGIGACIIVHAAHNLLFLLISGFAAVSHLPLILAVAGIWLIAIAVGWQYRPAPRYQRRILLRSSLAMALCFLLLHDARRLHDEIWLEAATYQLAHPRNDLALVLERCGPDQRVRVLDPQRRHELGQSLLTSPWQIPPDRLLPILATLDQNSLLLHLAEQPEHAVPTIATLATLPDEYPAIPPMARRICRFHRDAFRHVAMDHWEMLASWFPAKIARQDLIDLLASTRGPQRIRLLAHISEAYDRNESLACILGLPPESVGPRDRVWLAKHCPDPESVLRAAFANDPARAQAWSWHH